MTRGDGSPQANALGSSSILFPYLAMGESGLSRVLRFPACQRVVRGTTLTFGFVLQPQLPHKDVYALPSPWYLSFTPGCLSKMRRFTARDARCIAASALEASYPLRRFKNTRIPRQHPSRSFHASAASLVVKPYLLADIGEG